MSNTAQSDGRIEIGLPLKRKVLFESGLILYITYARGRKIVSAAAKKTTIMDQNFGPALEQILCLGPQRQYAPVYRRLSAPRLGGLD